jgi:hypothetical protein
VWKYLEAIIYLVIGTCCLYSAFATEKFYPGLPGIRRNKHPIPTSLGRLIFLGVGTAFLYFAVKGLK